MASHEGCISRCFVFNDVLSHKNYSFNIKSKGVHLLSSQNEVTRYLCPVVSMTKAVSAFQYAVPHLTFSSGQQKCSQKDELTFPSMEEFLLD